jgi:hypothetical protein
MCRARAINIFQVSNAFSTFRSSWAPGSTTIIIFIIYGCEVRRVFFSFFINFDLNRVINGLFIDNSKFTRYSYTDTFNV